jgi:HEAT repeat protein
VPGIFLYRVVQGKPVHYDDGLMAEQVPEPAPLPDGNGPEAGDESEQRIAYYLHMLADDNVANRWKAAESLGRLADPRTTDPLIDALFDDDARVRTKVAWALGSIGDPRALTPLKQLYRIERQDQREIIEEAIAMIQQRMSGG